MCERAFHAYSGEPFPYIWGGLDLAILEYLAYSRTASLNQENWELYSTPE